MTAIDDVELYLLRELQKTHRRDDGDDVRLQKIHGALELLEELREQYDVVNTNPVAQRLPVEEFGLRCPCGWKPQDGVIGGETLEEHQRFCPKAPPKSWATMLSRA